MSPDRHDERDDPHDPDEDTTIEAPDGRRIAWCRWGDGPDPAVFVCHGTPGARLFRPFMQPGSRQYITFDRPGYGGSDPAGHLSAAEISSDIVAIADHLDLSDLRVIGISGGGAYALCAAARHPDRIGALALCGSVAPMARNADTAGMMLLNRLSFGMARSAPWLLWPVLAAIARQAASRPDRLVDFIASGFAAIDQPILERPEVREMLRQDLREVFRQGGIGLFHDMGRLAGEWGAAPEDLRVPATLFHGGQDRNVPERAARQLAERIPGARLELDPGAGHLLFFDRWEDVVDSVLEPRA